MKGKMKIVSIMVLLVALLLVAAGCGTSIKEGSYTGKAAGYHGEITVTTEIDKDGKIANVTVGENTETAGIGTIAIEKMPQKIVEAQALDVDAVTGATVTSQAIIGAVADALSQAGGKPEKYGYTEVKKENAEAGTWDIDPSTMPEKLPTTGSVTLTDVKGREVTIDLPISSYAISTMDVIDYIIPLEGENAFKMLVASGQDGGGGIQKYSKLYTDKVGDYTKHVGQISEHNAPFDLEMVLAMDPDVLIVNSAMSAHKYALEIEEQLNAAGIKLVLIDVPGKSLNTSVQQTMGILGKIFQEEAKAAEVSQFMDTQYQLIAAKNLAQRTDKPTVYYEKSGYSEVYGSTATSKSGWGLPIAIAGGKNIADDVLLNSSAASGSSNTLDPEYVIQANPQFIIMSGVNDGWLSILKEDQTYAFDIVNRKGWSDLQAIKNNNVHEFAHASSRSIYAFYPCLKMAKLFYPTEFADVDPDAVLNEFFDRFMILDSEITDWYIPIEDTTASK